MVVGSSALAGFERWPRRYGRAGDQRAHLKLLRLGFRV